MSSPHRRTIDRLVAASDAARARLSTERATLAEARLTYTATCEAGEAAQQIAQELQRLAHNRIARVVTRCLAAVFGDTYTFRIKFERKRNRTEAILLFVDAEGNEVDPCNGAGGGVVDVAAFALRLAAIALTHPRRRRLVVLDEPFRFVSVQYRPAIREMLLTLAKETGFQFVMVTHMDDLRCGTIVEIGDE